MFDEATISRFLAKVEKTDTCWIWKAYINHDGYGGFQFSGKWSTAHRFSYLLYVGPIPENMEVRHICHVPACCNPSHLALGTHDDNMRDMALSGRRKGFRIKQVRLPKYKPTLEERFYKKVNKDGPIQSHIDTPCWMWTGWLDGIGYGRISVSGKLILAHRFSYEFFNGPFSPELDILHKCDNPTCVNPAHLFLGTAFDNMRDMVNKGRNVVHKGEGNFNAKLTQSQVDEIRYKSTFTTQVQLAKEYGVTQANIGHIVKRKNWKI